MQLKLRRFIDDVSGATAVEYAFLAVLISVVLVAAATSIGTELATVFNNVDTGFKNGAN
ncbi:MAG: Flp family type IVb pilin [Bacteroidota bacterium]|jgi:pilus assembly protein Flp/PilA